MPSPASLNFVASANNACIIGVTFRAVLTCYDDADGVELSDLTGLAGRFRVTDAAGAVVWEGDTDGGEVVIDVVEATVTIVISAVDTDTFTAGTYHVDIDLIDTAASPDEVDRIAHGEFQVIK